MPERTEDLYSLMKTLGLESIAADLAVEGYFVKCIVNLNTAVFFPGTIQHRDMKREGVSYEDDYLGNAMAAQRFADSWQRAWLIDSS